MAKGWMDRISGSIRLVVIRHAREDAACHHVVWRMGMCMTIQYIGSRWEVGQGFNVRLTGL
jgi:hypothetical protein